MRTARKRRPGLRAGIAIGIVVLVIVLIAVADGIVRSYAAGEIEKQVRSGTSIPASTPVDVTVGGFSVLLQLATGKLDDVGVAVDGLAVGELNGDATATATGVPTDTTKPIGEATLVFSANQEQLKKLLAGFSGAKISTVAIAKGAVQVGTEFTILGTKLPVAVALTPSAVDGEISLVPKSLTVGGRTLSAADVQSNFGSIAGDVLKPQKICVAEYLPKDLRLQSVAVKGSRVELTVSGKNLTLNDSLLTTKGVCP